MTAADPTRPRLLLVSFYPLDEGQWGPTVRISAIRDALGELSRLDVVAGYRTPRARALWSYFRSGLLAGLDGIYVESATTLPGPADAAFLLAARRRGIPVLTYVRDAYPLFDEYADASPRGRLRRALFLPAFRSLARASTHVAFPSQGLANAMQLGAPTLVLPPGAPPPVLVPRAAGANRVLHVGSLRHPDMGAALLMAAVDRARSEGADVELTCVARSGDEPPGPYPSWLRQASGSGSQIHGLLAETFATIIPRRKTPYNDLAVPIKLMDALSYGRPTIVTDCTETARIVAAAASGPIVQDTVEAVAAALVDLRHAAPEVIERYSAAAHGAARTHPWSATATRIVDVLAESRP